MGGRMFYDLLFPQLLPNLTKDSKNSEFRLWIWTDGNIFWRKRDLKSRAMSPDVEKARDDV